MGKVDSSLSFTVRPSGSKTISLNSTYTLIHNADTGYQKGFSLFNGSGHATLLPVTFTQQFNTHHPYGWNDGSMIPAKGYQTLVSTGVYASLGMLEIQLQPEFVFAANNAYEKNADYGPVAVLPSYKKIFGGQSFISLSKGPLSVGVSTENLWWGPGIKSSLLMSNNAPGFLHAFLRTRRPITTGVGSFEFQLIGGKLTSDYGLVYDIFNMKQSSLPNDWRYLNSLVITYHPKWVNGLFLGFARSLQRYSEDLNIPPNGLLSKYLPILTQPLEKKNASGDDGKKTDQLASFFMRWLFNRSHAEFYVEYGFNDYGVNFRDYIMAPTHSAAYLAGFKKIFMLPEKAANLELGFELTQMSQSPDYLVRQAGNWYQHGQVLQGYTNNNQIIGAGAGLGANVQSLTATYSKGWKKLGILLERVERDPLNHVNNWIDISVGIMPQYKYHNLVLSGKFQFINSSNYIWEKDINRFNLHSRLVMQYLF